MSEEKKEIRKILDQLFAIHKVYKNTEDNKKHIMISEKCEPLFIRLEGLGVARAFSETFLCFGDEFLIYEFGMSWESMKKGKR